MQCSSSREAISSPALAALTKLSAVIADGLWQTVDTSLLGSLLGCAAGGGATAAAPSPSSIASLINGLNLSTAACGFRCWEFHLDVLPREAIAAQGLLPPPLGGDGADDADDAAAAFGVAIVDVNRRNNSFSSLNSSPPPPSPPPLSDATKAANYSVFGVCIVKERLPLMASTLAEHIPKGRGGRLRTITSPSPVGGVGGGDEGEEGGSNGALSSVYRSSLSLLLLLVSPMSYSVWNDRRRWALEEGCDGSTCAKEFVVFRRLLFELHFVNLIMAKYPKLPEVMAQRTWVCDQLLLFVLRRGEAAHTSPSSSPLCSGPSSLLFGLTFYYLLLDPTSLRALVRASDAHHRNYPLWFSHVRPMVTNALRLEKRLAAAGDGPSSRRPTAILDSGSNGDGTPTSSSNGLTVCNSVCRFAHHVSAFYLPFHDTDHTALQCVWGLMLLAEGERADAAAAAAAGRRGSSATIHTTTFGIEDAFVALLSMTQQGIMRGAAQCTMRLLRPVGGRRASDGDGAAEEKGREKEGEEAMASGGCQHQTRPKKVRRPAHSDEGHDSLFDDGDEGHRAANGDGVGPAAATFVVLPPVTEGSWQMREMLARWYLGSDRRGPCSASSSPPSHFPCAHRGHLQRCALSRAQREFVENELYLVSQFVGSDEEEGQSDEKGARRALPSAGCSSAAAPWPIAHYALAYGQALLNAVGRASSPAPSQHHFEAPSTVQ